MLQPHPTGNNKVNIYSKATRWYSVSWLTCPRFVAEPRRVGIDLDLFFRSSACPAPYFPKCLSQTYDTKNRPLCLFVHPNTEQRPRFARLWPMMSLQIKTMRRSYGRSSLYHGRWNKFSVDQSRGRGGNLSAIFNFPFFYVKNNSNKIMRKKMQEIK